MAAAAARYVLFLSSFLPIHFIEVVTLKMIIIDLFRREIEEVIVCGDSSDSSIDEDDIDLLFLNAMFPSMEHSFSKLILDDLSESQCEDMFRQEQFINFIII